MARAPRVAPSETEFLSMRRIVVEYLCSRLSDHQLATFITLQFGKGLVGRILLVSKYGYVEHVERCVSDLMESEPEKSLQLWGRH